MTATTQMAAILGGVHRGKGCEAEALLSLVPSLTEGALVSAHLGYRARLGYVAAELTLRVEPRFARIRQRLAFWFAREGGWARTLEPMAEAEAERFRETLSHCDVALLEVPPERWGEAVRKVFAATGIPAPEVPPTAPELRLQVGGPGWIGFTYDTAERRLELPSPIAPPLHDELTLLLEPVGDPRDLRRAVATVAAVRPVSGASATTPAGFSLVLRQDAAGACSLLTTRCPRKATAGDTRIAPRYRVVTAARVADSEEELLAYEADDEFLHDHLTDLSHSGAFVRTSRRRRIGEHVTLHLRLPDRRSLRVPATVVRCTPDGVGLQFQGNRQVNALLSSTIASLSGRRRRVLVADDDALVRQIVSDALEAHGFEVLLAPDGAAALRTISDELLTLDAVVTDHLMPGLSGEALVTAVRNTGGERDLVIVVIGASLDERFSARLVAAGADAVIPKRAGADAVVNAVEQAIDGRARSQRSQPPAPSQPQRQVASAS